MRQSEQKAMTANNMIAKLERSGYQVKKLTPYQFRAECVLDIYPVNRRFINIATRKSGGWAHLKDFDAFKSFVDEQVAAADAILDKAIAEGKFQEELCRMDQPEPQQRTLALGEKKRFLREKDKPFWARG